MLCNSCPRRCNIDRAEKIGYCGAGEEIRIARAAPHMWEEPCISGSRGSGAVFFCGCNLKCVYCQNRTISRDPGAGEAVSPERLAEIFSELKSTGVHNINLVTPSHFAKNIAEALDICSPLPVIYNCGGYESVETVKMLGNRISIWMPDFKYADTELAKRLSGARDYPEVALRAILQMFRESGDCVLDTDGLMRSGVLIRHLVLPGHIDNSKAVIDCITDNFPHGSVLFSLMGQYTPPAEAVNGFPELGRRVTCDEYSEVCEYMKSRGLYDGYIQELDSASEEYTPAFDLTGVKKI